MFPAQDLVPALFKTGDIRAAEKIKVVNPDLDWDEAGVRVNKKGEKLPRVPQNPFVWYGLGLIIAQTTKSGLRLNMEGNRWGEWTIKYDENGNEVKKDEREKMRSRFVINNPHLITPDGKWNQRAFLHRFSGDKIQAGTSNRNTVETREVSGADLTMLDVIYSWKEVGLITEKDHDWMVKNFIIESRLPKEL
jgi:hypothetical protein